MYKLEFFFHEQDGVTNNTILLQLVPQYVIVNGCVFLMKNNGCKEKKNLILKSF